MTTMATANVDIIAGGRIFVDIQRFLGMWHWQEHKADTEYSLENATIWQRYKRHILHSTLSIPFISLMFVEAALAKDLIQAGDTFYMSFAEAAFLIKLYNITQLREKAWRFINEIGYNQIFQLRSDAERRYWQGKQRFFRLLMLSYVSGSILVGILAFTAVLFAPNYELPFAYWVPCDIQVKRNYWLAYFYELFAIHLTAVGNATSDVLLCYFMLSIAMLYKLIGMRLNALNDLDDEEEAVKGFKHIFQLHSTVKRLTTDCETLISRPMMGQIFFSALILCFTGYRMLLMNMSEAPGQFAAMFQFLGVMLSQIFVLCYYGNEITVNATALTSDVYKTNWIAYSAKTRKILILFLEFLKRPVRVRAMGFFEVGLPMFTRVLNNAYSVFAILLNTQKT